MKEQASQQLTEKMNCIRPIDRKQYSPHVKVALGHQLQHLCALIKCLRSSDLDLLAEWDNCDFGCSVERCYLICQ